MSLITRCSTCGTTFKVVTDQLKVSRGWVRCGYCAAVFDASLHLQATPLPSQSRVGPSTSGPAPEDAAATIPADLEPRGSYLPKLPAVPTSGLLLKESGVDTKIGGDGHTAAPVQERTANSELPNRHKQKQAARASEREPESGRVEAMALRRASLGASARRASRAVAASADDEASGWPEDEFDTDEDVTFVRDARRDSPWSGPLRRGALVLLALLLTIFLAVQVMVQNRDAVAAAEPGLRPLVETFCEKLNCEVGTLRRIESVVIDSSSFTKTDIDSYRLSVSFKNAGSTPVAMPALEVTLTDLQDQPLVRKVILPAQLGAKSAVLGVGADFKMQICRRLPIPQVLRRPSARACRLGRPEYPATGCWPFIPDLFFTHAESNVCINLRVAGL
jgi:predicted Zn finger-like uncharacterized protein